MGRGIGTRVLAGGSNVLIGTTKAWDRLRQRGEDHQPSPAAQLFDN
jgi:hypothetical protein